jgi:hypothetical protein
MAPLDPVVAPPTSIAPIGPFPPPAPAAAAIVRRARPLRKLPHGRHGSRALVSRRPRSKSGFGPQRPHQHRGPTPRHPAHPGAHGLRSSSRRPHPAAPRRTRPCRGSKPHGDTRHRAGQWATPPAGTPSRPRIPRIPHPASAIPHPLRPASPAPPYLRAGQKSVQRALPPDQLPAPPISRAHHPAHARRPERATSGPRTRGRARPRL